MTRRLVSLALAAVLGAGAGVLVEHPRRSGPVCHSATEDSVIGDCDYRDGAWYQR